MELPGTTVYWFHDCAALGPMPETGLPFGPMVSRPDRGVCCYPSVSAGCRRIRAAGLGRACSKLTAGYSTKSGANRTRYPQQKIPIQVGTVNVRSGGRLIEGGAVMQ